MIFITACILFGFGVLISLAALEHWRGACSYLLLLVLLLLGNAFALLHDLFGWVETQLKTACNRILEHHVL